jgi:hypothetical protein
MTDTNPFRDLNTDPERELIIFGEKIDVEKIAYFTADDFATGDPIAPETAQTLLDRGYVLPDGRQNDGPTARRLLDTARSYDDRTGAGVAAFVCGYVIPAARPDARVTFTTLRLESDGDPIPEDIQTAVRNEFERGPDELSTTDTVVRAWWD